MRNDAIRQGGSPLDLSRAFLEYCLVLEILFGESSNTTYMVASRAALFAADQPDERIEAVRRIKALYGLRSSFVHTGSTNVRFVDLADVREIVRRSLLGATLVAKSKLTSFLAGEAQAVAAGDQQGVAERMQGVLATDWLRRHCELVRFGDELVP